MQASKKILEYADKIIASISDPADVWTLLKKTQLCQIIVPTEYLYSIKDIEIFLVKTNLDENVSIACAGHLDPATAFRLATHPDAKLIEHYEFFDDNSVVFWFRSTSTSCSW